MKINLKNGTAIIRDFVNRKTQKEYKEKLFKNVKIHQGMEAEELELDLVSAEDANDSLVFNMIETLNNRPVTLESIEQIDSDDFNLILEKCQAILNKNNDSKKKSESSTETQ